MGRKSASVYAYEQLKSKILEWEYEPGMQLTEETLTETIQVSRTPLRQAIHQLEHEGLIVRQSNGRLQAAPITFKEVEETYKVREVLEALLAKEAAEQMTKEKLAELEDVLELMQRAAEQKRMPDLMKYGSQFHAILYSLSSNETAKRFLEQLNSRIERYRRIGGYQNPKYVLMLPVEEHKNIFQAICKEDSEQVEIVMRAHIRRSWEAAKETLEAKLLED